MPGRVGGVLSGSCLAGYGAFLVGHALYGRGRSMWTMPGRLGGVLSGLCLVG